MTTRPSIESLRAIVYGMKEPSTTEEIEALDAALSELAAYREREPMLIAHAEKAEADADERHARLVKLADEHRPLRAERDALAAMVEALKNALNDLAGYAATVLPDRTCDGDEDMSHQTREWCIGLLEEVEAARKQALTAPRVSEARWHIEHMAKLLVSQPDPVFQEFKPHIEAALKALAWRAA